MVKSTNQIFYNETRITKKEQFLRKVRPFLAEVFGTFLIVVIGTATVSSGVMTGSISGLWQAGSVWGVSVALAIYATGSISGAHLNRKELTQKKSKVKTPYFKAAISAAFCLYNSFGVWNTLLYTIAQLLGAFLAGLVNFGLYNQVIKAYELKNNITRGSAGSEHSAMVFGEYFPNPDTFPPFSTSIDKQVNITPLNALMVEAFGTAVLAFVIFAVSDKNNKTILRGMEPYFIGFTVAVLICALAPLTQCGINPARDFGPRIVAYFAGWGDIAIPGPNNGFWIYILGPYIGAILGGGLYQLIFKEQDKEKVKIKKKKKNSKKNMIYYSEVEKTKKDRYLEEVIPSSPTLAYQEDSKFNWKKKYLIYRKQRSILSGVAFDDITVNHFQPVFNCNFMLSGVCNPFEILEFKKNLVGEDQKVVVYSFGTYDNDNYKFETGLKEMFEDNLEIHVFNKKFPTDLNSIPLYMEFHDYELISDSSKDNKKKILNSE
ncbi:hypothetical protein HK099_007949, partial [Clydaea vesicula]